MLTLKKLEFSNTFSYGSNNQIDFTAAQLTQLVGRNGHGKSSIALVVEEVLFNKNSKGIKKADILNRYVKDKFYTIKLSFDKDGTAYSIETKRGATQTVKLYRGGEDISGHTPTQTYKLIEGILGMDHKSFTQIVYQSNANSLEFLTSPDTARKKFLIETLNLSKYTKAQEVFKEAAAAISKEVSAAQAKVATTKSWLDKYEGEDLTERPLAVVEGLDPDLLVLERECVKNHEDIEILNSKISKNNTYKQQRDGVKLLPVLDKPDSSEYDRTVPEVARLSKESVELNKTVGDSEKFIQKIRKLVGMCPTCYQPIDSHNTDQLISEQESVQEAALARLSEISSTLESLYTVQNEYTSAVARWDLANKSKATFDKYSGLVDSGLPDKEVLESDLLAKLSAVRSEIADIKKRISAAEKHNEQVRTHNTKVQLVSQQLLEMRKELSTHSEVLQKLSDRMSIISVLNKTFSTTGLVAYKIESMVKDLEDSTNKYLVDLSDGRFQISFKVNSSDKLNVIISDNGNDIDISALSGGEKARVNVATLLALRKLMQTLSASRINLLILDETVEALDVDGKEKLVEVLLKEEHLNTFLVSHGFTNPLLEKVNIVKHNNISKIEV